MHPRRAMQGHSLALASRRAQDRFAGSETERMILIPSSQCSPGGLDGRGLRFLVREVRRHSHFRQAVSRYAPSRREGVGALRGYLIAHPPNPLPMGGGECGFWWERRAPSFPLPTFPPPTGGG